ncbi:hypothetical protein WA026_003816 [Henosepilachna vigintioctopunctata]|uniref:Uncharacterized protein n=1 Tax=Henosepilachna vigintioctopunctata TaxID=420089 RepID=A0AAW1UH02_9CUCU
MATLSTGCQCQQFVYHKKNVMINEKIKPVIYTPLTRSAEALEKGLSKETKTTQQYKQSFRPIIRAKAKQSKSKASKSRYYKAKATKSRKQIANMQSTTLL